MWECGWRHGVTSFRVTLVCTGSPVPASTTPALALIGFTQTAIKTIGRWFVRAKKNWSVAVPARHPPSSIANLQYLCNTYPVRYRYRSVMVPTWLLVQAVKFTQAVLQYARRTPVGRYRNTGTVPVQMSQGDELMTLSPQRKEVWFWDLSS